ncbi:response regulator [Endozoicomonas sp. 8E]|uniref:response regulator n=1 Tax=Endozoicomonas sp. 8E TaxID=3035692 RepID=UPI002938D4B7|nr:response regulator [Endozoicomonas sp. 8E]WOG28373.1 response regulator [Endozoicomonas sp. 8E]
MSVRETYNLHILVVEDSQVNQMVVKKLLEKLGCTCKVAENGQEALDTLETSEAFDLILMDCMMPIMDGLEATEKIRASGQHYAGIPVIAFTANTSESDQLACKSAGMDDFLDKPVSLACLSEKLALWTQD